MQKIILLLFMATACSLVACKKSGKAESEESGPLVGKWKLKDQRISPGTPVIDFTPVTYDAYVEFKNNGEVVWTDQQTAPIIDTYEIVNDSLLKITRPGAWTNSHRYKATQAGLTLGMACIEECTNRYTRVAE